jgi:hypothetical protein
VDVTDFNTYTGDTATALDAKVDTSLFDTYTGDTATALNAKVDVTDFNIYTGDTQTALDAKVDTSLFDTYTGNTQTALDAKVDTSLFDTYTGDTATALDAKVDTSLFDTYTGDTETALNAKVDTSLFDTYTGDTATVLDTKIDTITSTGGTVTVVDNGTSVNLEAQPTLSRANLFEVFEAGTTQATSITYVSVPWDTTVLLGSDYSYAGANITFNTDGIYEITYGLNIVADTNNQRRQTRSRLQLDTGAGYSGEVARASAYGYHRTSLQGLDTLTKTVKLDLSSGDRIRIQFNVVNGVNTCSTVANESNITITRLTD